MKLKLDTSGLVGAAQRALLETALDIENRAKINAPFREGHLYNSIHLSQSNRNSVNITAGNSGVRYALRREYENNLHPQRRHYMAKALQAGGSAENFKRFISI